MRYLLLALILTAVPLGAQTVPAPATVTVSAAISLTDALTAIADRPREVRSWAGVASWLGVQG